LFDRIGAGKRNLSETEKAEAKQGSGTLIAAAITQNETSEITKRLI
jgi:hypothetical protein